LFADQMQCRDRLEAFSCQSFDQIFAKVVAGEAEFAVVPLENSSVGSIAANYDLLWRSPVIIVSEVYLDVHHNLLALPGAKLGDIKEIYSHPVALEQCQKFLATVPGAKPIAHLDTSSAAFHVKNTGDPKLAAIASEFAAAETGLNILQRNVEDHSGNRTRFGIVMGDQAGAGGAQWKQRALEMVSRCDKYKLTCNVELAHEPGSLSRLLDAIARCSANLTKIESRPIPETPWHYRFFLDMQITRDQDACVSTALRVHANSSKILGRYPIWIDTAAAAGG
jgi:prephenate dehydratase